MELRDLISDLAVTTVREKLITGVSDSEPNFDIVRGMRIR
jgi:hypothetical protein